MPPFLYRHSLHKLSKALPEIFTHFQKNVQIKKPKTNKFIYSIFFGCGAYLLYNGSPKPPNIPMLRYENISII